MIKFINKIFLLMVMLYIASNLCRVDDLSTSNEALNNHIKVKNIIRSLK